MDTKDNITITGSVHIVLTGPDGKVKVDETRNNLVVTVGKTALATWLVQASQVAIFMPYMGLGTGVTSPASGDTTLTTEFAGGGYARQTATPTSSSNVLTKTAVFGAGVATGVVAEAGLFSASSSGTMFAHVLLGPYTKAAGDSLTVAWAITFN